MGLGKTWSDFRDRRRLESRQWGEEENKRQPTVDIVILVVLLHNVTVP